MSDAEIKTAYENNADTNEFSDAEQSKLAGIETGATGNQTNAEIKTAYEANADTNEFSDAEQSKLAGIATGAEVNPDLISKAEAEAGTATTERIFSALRVKQAIDALGSSGSLVKHTHADDTDTEGGILALIFDKLVNRPQFNNICISANWKQTKTGTGSITFLHGANSNSIQVNSGATSGGEAYVRYGGINAGSDSWFGVVIQPQAQNTQMRVVAGLYNDNKPTADTAKGYGFRYDVASSSGNIFAVNGNGSSSTTTDTGIAWTSATEIKLTAFRIGNTIKFYVDGVLKATHTTNMPGNENVEGGLYIKNKEDANKECKLKGGFVMGGLPN